MDRFQEMQVFIRIAERGSFTRAADDLQIPRATVTNLMKRMEERLGTRLLEFPPGDGKSIADQACLACHATDMVRQQRLTEKQWAAEVTKMAVWGADIPQDKREELVAYLVNNFGPGAPKYEPVLTRPVGR